MYKQTVAGLMAVAMLLGCQDRAESELTRSALNNNMFQAMGNGKQKLARDPIPLLKAANAALLQRDPQAIRAKYQAMAESPFVFYRATAPLFYADMRQQRLLPSRVNLTLQGDFHVENLGTYRSAQGQWAYDLNDFDESFSGAYTWELLRGAVSIQLAMDENGFGKKDREAQVAHFLGRYLAALKKVSQQPAQLSRPLGSQELTKKPVKAIEKSSQTSQAAWLAEMTSNTKFRPSDKIVPLSTAHKQMVAVAVAQYAAARRQAAFFQVKDAAARIAGKGSLGRYRYVALIEGPSANPQDDIILEIKEAAPPSATGGSSANQAQRIVKAYQYFLPQADPLLGVTRIHNLEAFVRELQPKETVDISDLDSNSKWAEFLDSVALIAARAHARSGQANAILAENPNEQRLIDTVGEWAKDYDNQVRDDFAAFKAALQNGTLLR